VLVKTDQLSPVDSVYTDYESAMMVWAGEAATGERHGGEVTEKDGVYTVEFDDARIVMQEYEL
jgi:hypothetical protein